MGEHDINAMNNAASKVNENVGGLRKSIEVIKNSILSIHDWFGKTIEAIAKSAQKQIEANCRIEIFKHIADLGAQEEVIDIITKNIEGKLDDYKEDIKLVNERYEKLNSLLNTQVDKTIISLDNHIYEMYQQFYENKISKALTHKALPRDKKHLEYYNDCNELRRVAVEGMASISMDKVQEFLDKRNDYRKDIYKYKSNNNVETPLNKGIEFFIIDERDEENIMFIGDLKIDGDMITYNENENYKDIKDDINNKKQEYYKQIEYKVISEEQKDTMLNMAENLFEKEVLTNYGDELKDVLMSAIKDLDIMIGGDANYVK